MAAQQKIGALGARQERDAEHSILFTRPHTMKSIGYVLGIVLSSGLLIASLVFSLLRLIL